MKLTKCLAIILFSVFVAGYSVGCVEVRGVSLEPGKYQPRAKDHNIELHAGIAPSEAIVLGSVSANGCPWCTDEYVVSKIKERAREMGGDAIYNFRSYTAPTGTVGAGGLTIQGTAVRY